MKWLIILLILLVVIALVALRYRQQILMLWQIRQMYKKMREAGKPTERKIETASKSKDVALVRCERCGNWIPQSEAMNLRSKTFYCSAKCMERAVKLQSMVD